MIKAVVFDLDGTLVHFDIDYRALKEEVLRALARLGVPVSSLSPDDTLTDMLSRVEAYAEATGRGEEFMRKVWNEAIRVIERFEASSADRIRPVPGAADVLMALKGKGMKIGLITLNSSAVAVNTLKRLGIDRLLDAMVARDFVREAKPNPDHLMKVLEELGVKPEETVVVGDTVLDIRCGKKLGAVAIGITTGRSSRDELERAGADFIISSLSELIPIIDGLNSRAR